MGKDTELIMESMNIILRTLAIMSEVQGGHMTARICREQAGKLNEFREENKQEV